MFLARFVRSSSGKIVMSIILGLGLATLFRQVCAGRECLVYKAPPLDEIEDNVYKVDNKCYKFKKRNVSCSTKKTILDMDINGDNNV